MSRRKVPRARARRSKSVERIVEAYEKSNVNALGFSQLRKTTGMSSSALKETIQEMVELGSIIREVTEDSPPQVNYIVVEALADDVVKELEEKYSEEYQKIQGLLGYITSVEHEAMRQGLGFIRRVYMAKPIVRDRTHARPALRILYFKWLRKCHHHLQNVMSLAYDNEELKEWEKCTNCQHSKYIVGRQIDGKPAIRCTYLWQDRESLEDRVHPSDYHCWNFKPKRPQY